jgi:hypothetical protein
LIESKADATITNNRGFSCADVCEDEEIIDYLLKNGAFLTEKGDYEDADDYQLDL